MKKIHLCLQRCVNTGHRRTDRQTDELRSVKLKLHLFDLLFRIDSGMKYCDEGVCMSVILNLKLIALERYFRSSISALRSILYLELHINSQLYRSPRTLSVHILSISLCLDKLSTFKHQLKSHLFSLLLPFSHPLCQSFSFV